MTESSFLKEANALQKKLSFYRRWLHKNAETGFDLNKTLLFVKTQLEKAGCAPKPCGRAGLLVSIGTARKNANKTFLLRADMDALPIREETELPFASRNGNMHACGHDMHTAMLLGAATLLKKHEKELCGRVTLLFQPAEELLEGAKDILGSGALDDPKPHAAMMLHVLTDTQLPTGTILLPPPGVSAPAADFFTIDILGKGCHGSAPHEGVDALLVAAYLVIALQELSSRELAIGDEALLTIGSFHAGEAGNVLADRAKLRGSLRAFDETVRQRLKKRMSELTDSIAKAYRAKAALSFDSGCPALQNDEALCSFTEEKLKTLLGEKNVLSASAFAERQKGGGSEDFAYIARQIPALSLFLAAGNTSEGFSYPLHHPKVCFDERVLPIGSAAYAYVALSWLRENG